MSAVLADKFFYQALLDQRDPAHGRALAQLKVKQAIVTTEFVLLESGNACSRAEDHADFLALLAGFARARARALFRLIHGCCSAAWIYSPRDRTRTGL